MVEPTKFGALAVVLAAGGGSRYVGAAHKLVVPFRGRPLVAWAIEAAVGSGLSTVVVDGALDLTDLASELGASAVHNLRWAEGQATSLQAGLTAAAATGHDAAVVGLGDQPLVPAAAWRAVAAADTTAMAVAAYDGRRANPVRLAATVWPLLPTEGDAGARHLLAERPEEVTAVACPGNPADVDTVEDLARWS